MILPVRLWSRNHRTALDIFYDQFEMPIIEEVTDCQSSTCLRNLNSRSRQFAYIAKSPVMLIEKQYFRLTIFGSDVFRVHLRINMPVDQREVQPSIIVDIEKRVTPADIRNCRFSNTRIKGHIREVPVSIIAKKS